MDKTTPTDETLATTTKKEVHMTESGDSIAARENRGPLASDIAALQGKIEQFVFRTSLAAVVAILFGGILLFAASGRLAGEIDNMQASFRRRLSVKPCCKAVSNTTMTPR